MSAREVSVLFKTHYFLYSPNHRVALVGSDRRLGNWNISKCLFAEEHFRYRAHWTVSVVLPVDNVYTWKWVIVTSDRQKVVRWEEAENRDINVTVSKKYKLKHLEVIAPWNHEEDVLSIEETGVVYKDRSELSKTADATTKPGSLETSRHTDSNEANVKTKTDDGKSKTGAIPKSITGVTSKATTSSSNDGKTGVQIAVSAKDSSVKEKTPNSSEKATCGKDSTTGVTTTTTTTTTTIKTNVVKTSDSISGKTKKESEKEKLKGYEYSSRQKESTKGDVSKQVPGGKDSKVEKSVTSSKTTDSKSNVTDAKSSNVAIDLVPQKEEIVSSSSVTKSYTAPPPRKNARSLRASTGDKFPKPSEDKSQEKAKPSVHEEVIVGSQSTKAHSKPIDVNIKVKSGTNNGDKGPKSSEDRSQEKKKSSVQDELTVSQSKTTYSNPIEVCGDSKVKTRAGNEDIDPKSSEVRSQEKTKSSVQDELIVSQSKKTYSKPTEVCGDSKVKTKSSNEDKKPKSSEDKSQEKTKSSVQDELTVSQSKKPYSKPIDFSVDSKVKTGVDITLKETKTDEKLPLQEEIIVGSQSIKVQSKPTAISKESDKKTSTGDITKADSGKLTALESRDENYNVQKSSSIENDTKETTTTSRTYVTKVTAEQKQREQTIITGHAIRTNIIESGSDGIGKTSDVTEDTLGSDDRRSVKKTTTKTVDQTGGGMFTKTTTKTTITSRGGRFGDRNEKEASGKQKELVEDTMSTKNVTTVHTTPKKIVEDSISTKTITTVHTVPIHTTFFGEEEFEIDKMEHHITCVREHFDCKKK